MAAFRPYAKQFERFLALDSHDTFSALKKGRVFPALDFLIG